MKTGIAIDIQMVMTFMMTIIKTITPVAMVIITFVRVVTMATVGTTIATPIIITIEW